jgi:hypothetical protein
VLLLRIVAAAIAVLGVAPLWRLLPQRPTGLAGAATAQAAAVYSSLMWNGLLLALIPGLLAALLLRPEMLESMLQGVARPLARVSARTYAITMALLATLLSAFVASFIMAGKPTLIDSFAQLMQARYLAAGQLAGPSSSLQQFWHLPQTIVTPNGWVSQYPPGYAALLAIGLRLHIVGLVGPIMLGVAVLFTTLIAEEVFSNRALARGAALLAALSPFMLAQAGAYMSHVPAAAFSAGALYFVLRCARGGWASALAAGVCLGVLFTIRPLTAVVGGVVAAAYLLLDRRTLGERAVRVGTVLAGALPFLIVIACYNAHFFGSATRFGYDAALGPNGALGWGVDPWGNSYRALDAVAYTSAELTALSVYLLETPVPLVLLVGWYFATSKTLSSAVRLLFWWVSALVIAYLFYWHHGLFMGPRMLADMGPLWVLLVVLSAAGLIAQVPDTAVVAGRYSVRAFALGSATMLLLAGMLVLTPMRLFSYTTPSDVQALLRAPQTSRPALVFVHGGWTARIAMRLAARGMRLDSIESALRQNSTCAVHHYALAYGRDAASATQLDFTPRATNLPANVELSPGNRIRVKPGEQIVGSCAAEMASDTAGVIDVSPYVWQGDLPGLRAAGALFVRDMGPAENAQLIARYQDREPLMLIEKNGTVQLIDYANGMRARWGDEQ